MSWKTIVVGYEVDHASDCALERAGEIAKDVGADLIVTSIARALPSGAAARGIGTFDPADPPGLRRAGLDERALLANGGARAEFDTEVGDPADAIVALAERRQADLIVVGTHDGHFLDRLLHGSVSQAVTRHVTARC